MKWIFILLVLYRNNRIKATLDYRRGLISHYALLITTNSVIDEWISSWVAYGTRWDIWLIWFFSEGLTDTGIQNRCQNPCRTLSKFSITHFCKPSFLLSMSICCIICIFASTSPPSANTFTCFFVHSFYLC